MTAESPPSTRSRFLGAVAAVAIAAALIGGGYAWVSRARVPASRPDPGNVLLSTSIDLGSEGASCRLRLRSPGTLSFSLQFQAPPLSVAFGPPRPQDPNGSDLPNPATAVSWTAKPGDAPHEERVYAAGLYVLTLTPARVEAPPSSIEPSVLPRPQVRLEVSLKADR